MLTTTQYILLLLSNIYISQIFYEKKILINISFYIS